MSSVRNTGIRCPCQLAESCKYSPFYILFLSKAPPLGGHLHSHTDLVSSHPPLASTAVAFFCAAYYNMEGKIISGIAEMRSHRSLTSQNTRFIPAFVHVGHNRLLPANALPRTRAEWDLLAEDCEAVIVYPRCIPCHSKLRKDKIGRAHV